MTKRTWKDKIGLDEAVYLVEKHGLAIVPYSIPTGGDDYDEGYVLVDFNELEDYVPNNSIIKSDLSLSNLILRYANND